MIFNGIVICGLMALPHFISIRALSLDSSWVQGSRFGVKSIELGTLNSEQVNDAATGINDLFY
jgi:hypothetical protein